jgi:hypothetical protein
MFTREIIFGMNLLSLAGFVLMGVALNLVRTARTRAPLCIGLMGAGTVMVFAGLYLRTGAD